MDGDSRGGAALSVRQISGKPIKFIGVGEKVEALQPFYPDRMASRILGMGDIITLVEKAQEAVDFADAEKIAAEDSRSGIRLRRFPQADAFYEEHGLPGRHHEADSRHGQAAYRRHAGTGRSPAQALRIHD